MKLLFTIFLFSIVLSFNLCSQNFDFSETDFRKADSVATLYTNHSLHDLKSLSTKLTRSFSTDVEKFRAIYYWVCNNIESDYQDYLLNEKKRKKFSEKPDRLRNWNSEFSKRVFTKLLNENKTICSGYAYIIKELAYWADLTCLIVDGYGRSVNSNVDGAGIPNHSWNVVQLSGHWYLCDATWSSGSTDPTTGLFKKKFDDVYFLPSPILFARNHFPLDTSMLLLEDKPSLSEFLTGPIVYKGIYKYQVNPIFPETFKATTVKDKTLSFQLRKGNGPEIKKVELQVNGRRVLQEIDLNSNGTHAIDYHFKNKGKYVVHLLLDSTYTFSYLVDVN